MVQFGVVALCYAASLLQLVSSKTSLRTAEDVTRHLAKMEYMAAMSVPLTCWIEHGFDYVSTDIKTVQSGYPEGCCWHCYTTDGCRAYSWTNLNGGTCWLKTGRGKIVVDPNVKSSLMVYGAPPPICALQSDVDFVGNDLGRVSSPTADGCCKECMNFLGCRAYTWTDYLGGSCWLKSTGGQLVSKPGAKSALAFPPDNLSPTCALEYDKDYVGNDISNVGRAAPGECCQVCRDTLGCRAYSWTNHNGGTCWLKSQKGEVISKAGVVSAPLDDLPPSCTLENDTDYVGNDIGNVPSGDAAGCCDKCKARIGCKAFSWSDYNGGTCWLKSAKSLTLSKPGVKSAVV